MVRKSRQLSIKECYEILNLQKGADLQAVKTAYRKRAFELHPDLHPGDRQATHQFQLLNEAYVALSAILKPVEEARQKAESHKQAAASQNEKGKKESQQAREDKTDQTQTSSENARAQQAYAEQDVLRDLLNDPFARRVFEDIYSELAKQQKDEEKNTTETKKEAPTQAQPKPTPQPKAEKSKPVRAIPLWERGAEKGVKGAVKDWLRKQIDEELHLTFPAARLTPGMKIPLTVSYGLKNETQTVEVTIPKNFVAGKPMRLKGLGKRLGPWQGDLYLTIHSI